MAYDVEKTMLHIPPGGFSKKTKRTIKSVNLMCYLQGNVTFNELYTQDFESALKKIIPRAKLLNDSGHKLPSLCKGAYTSSLDITAPLVQALEDVAKIIKGKKVILEKLFKSKFTDPNSPEYKLTQRFRKLYDSTKKSNGENDLEHFCFPVVAFQEGSAPLLGANGEPLVSFLTEFGKLTMYDLFVTARNRLTPAQEKILGNARTAHILIDATIKTIEPPSVKLFPPANGLICDRTKDTCKDSNGVEAFCNDANGSCSAMSYP